MEALTRLADKVENIELITKHLGEIDAKLVSQGERLDRVQAKMDLSMTSLGQVQLEQTQVARALKAAVPSAPVASPTPAHQLPPLLSTPAGASAASTSTAPPPPPRSPQVSRSPVHPDVSEGGDFVPRRQWSPKMDFPRFDGTDVRVWLDNCETYFGFYQIAEGFQVSAAALNMVGDASNWYQAWKLEVGWHDWAM